MGERISINAVTCLLGNSTKAMKFSYETYVFEVSPNEFQTSTQYVLPSGNLT